MIKWLTPLLLLLTMATSCTDTEPINTIEIKIHNDTGNLASNLVAYKNNTHKEYGDLENGQTSNVNFFSGHYVLDSITFSIHSQEFIIKPSSSFVLWAPAISGATYTYSIFPTTETNSDIPYSFTISSEE